ncbi:MAG: hypothetical protein IIC26_06090 [Chloroflexi bacterium]|nr:hypothetical protein [Chloroflexota bacterium]
MKTSAFIVFGVGLACIGLSTAARAEPPNLKTPAPVIFLADADDPVDDSIMAKIAAAGGDWSTFDDDTESLLAFLARRDLVIRDLVPRGIFENIKLLINVGQ